MSIIPSILIVLSINTSSPHTFLACSEGCGLETKGDPDEYRRQADRQRRKVSLASGDVCMVLPVSGYVVYALRLRLQDGGT